MSVIWPILSTGLLLAGAGAGLTGRLHERRWRWLGAVLLPLLALIPLGDASPWSWLTGLTGALSVMTVVLMSLYLLSALAGIRVLDDRSAIAVCVVVIVAGLVLYPMTLGLSLHDPYQWGYGAYVDYAVLGLALILWFSGFRMAAMLLSLVVLAGLTGLHASLNSWDCLIDPLLWLAAPVMLWRRLRA